MLILRRNFFVRLGVLIQNMLLDPCETRIRSRRCVLIPLVGMFVVVLLAGDFRSPAPTK